MTSVKNNTAKSSSSAMSKKAPASESEKNQGGVSELSVKPADTAIANCVKHELRRYFDLLDGEEPSNVYHLVMRQAEHALIESVMQECGGNQSKATKWLGISRGNLRNKLADMGYD